MKTKHILFIGLLIIPLSIFTQEPIDRVNQLEDEISLALDLEEPQKPEEQKIPFSFKAEPISNIVSMLAEYKKINIIEPSADSYKKLTVTFSTEENIPVDEAWNLLQTFLKLGGYAVVLKGEQYSIVQRTDQAQKLLFQKEVLPLYINVEPEELPFTDAPIRAMFFVENLSLPTPTTPGGTGTDAISQIFNDMLSQGAVKVFDPDTKSIVLTDSANLISSAMKVVYALDRGGVRETVEIVPLYNTSAGYVGNFLKAGLGITGGSTGQPAYLTRTQRAEGHPYFSPNTSIVSDDRSNSLILLGREANVDRLKQFIEEYIDVPPDKGESILHTYDLQHLDATETATVLNEVLAVPVAPTSGQAEVGTTQAGPERYFQNPVIIAETYKQVETAETIGTGATGISNYQQILKGDVTTFRPYQGGNRLIIAALSHDWQRIEDLLKKIDQPTEQVILEALVVDCSFTDDKFLRGAIRNPKAIGLQEGQSFQNQNLPANVPDAPDALVYEGTTTMVTGDLSVDLLKDLAQDPGNTLASFATRGTLMISFKDPMKSGIWGLIEVFQNNEDFKILQHPSVVTATNTTATIAFSENRRALGSVGYGAGGALSTPVVNYTAQLAISITPRTSSENRVNLTIAIENSDFTDNSQGVAFFDTRKRAIGTNINISNNQAVALGGLMNSQTETSETQVPFVSRIPFFGNFFRGTTKLERKTNLIFFISARVVKPRGTTHTREYTEDKLARGIYHLDDYDLFSTLQDPVTRFFFKKNYDEKHIINDYMLETQGKMLDPDTYTHDICNDEKVANKFADPQIPKPGDPPRFDVHSDDNTYKPENACAVGTQKLKERLATEENPLAQNSQKRHHTDFELSRSIDHMNDYRGFSAPEDPIAGTFLRKNYDEKHLINDYMLETRGEMLPPDMYQHDICNDEKVAHKFADPQIPKSGVAQPTADVEIVEDISDAGIDADLKRDVALDTADAFDEDASSAEVEEDFTDRVADDIPLAPDESIETNFEEDASRVIVNVEEDAGVTIEEDFGDILVEDIPTAPEDIMQADLEENIDIVEEDINNDAIGIVEVDTPTLEPSSLKELLAAENNPLLDMGS